MNTQIGRKFDNGKPEFSLLPPYALHSVAEVLTFGAKKYEVDNWKFVENGAYRYRNAALRHINEYIKGEQKDPESGINHLAHAICCLMFLLDADESGSALAPKKDAKPKALPKFDVPAVNYAFATRPAEVSFPIESIANQYPNGYNYPFLVKDSTPLSAITYKTTKWKNI